MSSFKALKIKRGRVKGCITRVANYIDQIGETTRVEELESRLKAVEDYWQEFIKIEDDLCEFEEEHAVGDENVNSGAAGEAASGSFEQVETKYLYTRASLLRAIRQSQGQQVNQQATSSQPSQTAGDAIDRLAAQQNILLQGLSGLMPTANEVALPKIVIPPFSGEYSAWTSFRDLFVGSVDNKPQLTPTQKFYYLVSFLRGEAATLLKNIPICDETYAEAWDKLEKRYDRPDLVALSYVKLFMDLPSTHKSNSRTLRTIIDGADECLRGLNGISANTRDPWLVYLLCKKLDSETRQGWLEVCSSTPAVTVYQLLNYLEGRFNQLESNDMIGASSLSKQSVIRAHVADNSSQACLKCKLAHGLNQCPEFASLNIESRRKFSKDHSLCFNCLKRGHNAARCNSSFRCRVCNARHHTLVHSSLSVSTHPSGSATNSKTSTANTSLFVSDTPTSSAVTHHEQPLRSNIVADMDHSTVILPTAIVKIQDQCGRYFEIRALIDSGSQVSFITETCVQRLGLQRTNARLCVSGVASSDAGVTKGRVCTKICSRVSDFEVDVYPYVLSRITSEIPGQNVSIQSGEVISQLNLADPHFGVSRSIELLLGADIVWSLFLDGKICLEHPHLYALNSVFGWIVAGNCHKMSANLTSYTIVLNVDELLQKFWDIEEGQINASTSNHDDPAELNFRRTHTRSAEGRYIVELPFTASNTTFGDTVSGAVSRLRGMENKFARNSELQTKYVQFMKEYILLGHMQTVEPENISSQPQYYLPHHAVFNPHSSTTKLRVVFDGSHKDSFGRSLNDTLLIGPPIQRDLFGVSLRFRRFAHVFTSDIVKMFRQIWVANQHRDYQRIVWRNSVDEPIQHFRLCTVTYGTASAPFLSVRVLQQLAIDNKAKLPRASDVILHNIYVDDIMVGAESLDELHCIKSELSQLLEMGGFKLSKWNSNSKEFLSSLSGDSGETSLLDTGLPTDKVVKILGLCWNPASDVYSFRVAKLENQQVTKRFILSEVSRVFDVYGWLSPSTIVMKIIFQKLWLLNVNWDDSVPMEIVQQWQELRQSIHHFETIKIPRRIYISVPDVEIHCFCDASAVAYACVIYSVFRSPSSKPVINIITAKARVAPLKSISIPRMELCAALLLCRLFGAVKRTLDISKAVLYAWTDSEVVLHWLSSPPRTWKMFVANRTEEILDTIARPCWNYVNTRQNPADCASRGLTPDQLVNHELWWNGPPWLQFNKDKWPISKFNEQNKLQCSADVLLEKKQAVVCNLESEENTPVLLEVAERCSSWNRLLRVVAYVCRFILICQRRHSAVKGPPTFEELHSARIRLLIAVQGKTFASTVTQLLGKQMLHQKDQLIKLSPFIDSKGLLRVGGRLQNTSISYSMKHPIILPRHHIAELIGITMHKTYLHAGVTELFVILRQHYWIIGARNLVRSIVFKCKRCFQLRRQTSVQIMANLPPARVQQCRPFLNSGCDFAGPLQIKMTTCKRPRITKAYICLFVCMSTKAMHIELVSELTSNAFIASFKRFTSRRGKCSNLYTDNGTNFHGARRSLDEMLRLLQDETTNADIRSSLVEDGTNWHFIPPSAPHFGGLWEAGVRSIKLHLRRVIGDSLLSFEELYTVLTQIEAILNSRPLCTISDTEINPLTPSHFLIGEPHTAIPEPCTVFKPTSRLTQWNWLQAMVQGFWKRWSNEYITSLQQRPKWQQPQTNFVIGDIVLLKEPNLPPTKWLLGRIIAVHPGQDSKVRVVTIKSEKGVYKRPITKIALLPSS